jgi:Zn-dependent protease
VIPPEIVDWIVAVGVALTAGMLAWMTRREELLVTIEAEGLACGQRLVPWEQIRRLVYVRGGYGAWFKVGTTHGVIGFRDDQLSRHPDRVRDRIVAETGMVDVPLEHLSVDMKIMAGDTAQEWALPDIAAAARAEQRENWDQAEREAWEDVAPEDGGRDPAGAKKVGIGLATLLLLLTKFGSKILFALTGAGGFLNLGSLWPTALSMAVTVWAFAAAWGWLFAVGLVALILVHELGHAAIMRAKGLRTGPIVFIPFMGAFIAVKDQFRDALVESETAYGGPAAGALAATACFLVWRLSDDDFALRHFFLGMAYVGFLFNLFNLLPVPPLDGGRVVTAISPALWVPGLLLAGFLAVRWGHPILVIIVLLGAVRAWRTFRQARGATPPGYFEIAAGKRALMAAGYFGLIAYLSVMALTANELSGDLGAS